MRTTTAPPQTGWSFPCRSRPRLPLSLSLPSPSPARSRPPPPRLKPSRSTGAGVSAPASPPPPSSAPRSPPATARSTTPAIAAAAGSPRYNAFGQYMYSVRVCNYLRIEPIRGAASDTGASSTPCRARPARLSPRAGHPFPAASGQPVAATVTTAAQPSAATFCTSCYCELLAIRFGDSGAWGMNRGLTAIRLSGRRRLGNNPPGLSSPAAHCQVAAHRQICSDGVRPQSVRSMSRVSRNRAYLLAGAACGALAFGSPAEAADLKLPVKAPYAAAAVRLDRLLYRRTYRLQPRLISAVLWDPAPTALSAAISAA